MGPLPSPESATSGSDKAPEITTLLNRMQQGDREAGEKAVGLVYHELHRIAARQLRQERPGHTLVTTALIHEAYLRLSAGQPLEVRNRGHFFAIASQQMRRILVDHARAKNAARRGGGTVNVGLDRATPSSNPSDFDVLALDEALKDLERVDGRAAKIVELRYFGGYTDMETVDALGLSLATVRRDWDFARCWLFDRLQNGAVRPAARGS